MKKIILISTLILFIGFIKTNAQTEVTFYTNQGSFVVTLDDWIMPITTGNFKSLVTAKFYDNVIFHRVINGFMIQGGDPTGTGFGGPGYTIQDEFITGQSNIQKTISMANTGAPNSAGSQFFINLVNNIGLDFDKAPFTSSHPVFGITTSNFSVVQAIGATPVDTFDKPITDVVMDSLRITKTGALAIKDEQNKLASIEIFPNPINENSLIEINVTENKTLRLCLITQEGKTIYDKENNFNIGKNKIAMQEIIGNKIANGNYYIGLSDGKVFIHKKIVVYK